MRNLWSANGLARRREGENIHSFWWASADFSHSVIESCLPPGGPSFRWNDGVVGDGGEMEEDGDDLESDGDGGVDEACRAYLNRC